jgi:hypothetical protein
MLTSAAFVGFMGTGCGSNSSSSATPAAVPIYNPYATSALTPYGAPSCASCPTNPSLLVSAVSDVGTVGASAAELGLYFFGDGNVIAQQQASYSAYYGYSGTVAATGYLNLAVPGCNGIIPAGLYQLQTYSIGTWGYGSAQSFNNLVLTTVSGPTMMTVSLGGYVEPEVTTSVGYNGTVFTDRMIPTAMVLQATTAGGITCDMSDITLYQSSGVTWQ